jgi:hypothetical protein
VVGFTIGFDWYDGKFLLHTSIPVMKKISTKKHDLADYKRWLKKAGNKKKAEDDD